MEKDRLSGIETIKLLPTELTHYGYFVLKNDVVWTECPPKHSWKDFPIHDERK